MTHLNSFFHRKFGLSFDKSKKSWIGVWARFENRWKLIFLSICNSITTIWLQCSNTITRSYSRFVVLWRATIANKHNKALIELNAGIQKCENKNTGMGLEETSEKLRNSLFVSDCFQSLSIGQKASVRRGQKKSLKGARSKCLHV